jgi:hypothetical protein
MALKIDSIDSRRFAVANNAYIIAASPEVA